MKVNFVRSKYDGTYCDCQFAISPPQLSQRRVTNGQRVNETVPFGTGQQKTFIFETAGRILVKTGLWQLYYSNLPWSILQKCGVCSKLVAKLVVCFAKYDTFLSTVSIQLGNQVSNNILIIKRPWRSCCPFKLKSWKTILVVVLDSKISTDKRNCLFLMSAWPVRRAPLSDIQ